MCWASQLAMRSLFRPSFWPPWRSTKRWSNGFHWYMIFKTLGCSSSSAPTHVPRIPFAESLPTETEQFAAAHDVAVILKKCGFTSCDILPFFFGPNPLFLWFQAFFWFKTGPNFTPYDILAFFAPSPSPSLLAFHNVNYNPET